MKRVHVCPLMFSNRMLFLLYPNHQRNARSPLSSPFYQSHVHVHSCFQAWLSQRKQTLVDWLSLVAEKATLLASIAHLDSSINFYQRLCPHRSRLRPLSAGHYISTTAITSTTTTATLSLHCCQTHIMSTIAVSPGSSSGHLPFGAYLACWSSLVRSQMMDWNSDSGIFAIHCRRGAGNISFQN